MDVGGAVTIYCCVCPGLPPLPSDPCSAMAAGLQVEHVDLQVRSSCGPGQLGSSPSQTALAISITLDACSSSIAMVDSCHTLRACEACQLQCKTKSCFCSSRDWGRSSVSQHRGVSNHVFAATQQLKHQPALRGTIKGFARASLGLMRAGA